MTGSGWSAFCRLDRKAFSGLGATSFSVENMSDNGLARISTLWCSLNDCKDEVFRFNGYVLQKDQIALAEKQVLATSRAGLPLLDSW